MPQMYIWQVIQANKSSTITFVLLDEQQQRILSFPLHENTFPGPMHIPTQQRTASAAPLTSDFLVNVLHVLGGIIEEVELDVLSGEQLYAHVHMRNQQGLQMVRASLSDALRLAHHERCTITVPAEIFDQ